MNKNIIAHHPACNTAFDQRTPQNRLQRQRGFTLFELIVTISIGAVLMVLALGGVRSIFIGSRVDPTAKDITQAIMRIRGNAVGGGASPYTSITTATLANTLRDRTQSLSVSAAVGAAATLTHSLGETGATVTVAPSTLVTAGDSFTITFNQVNKAACPDLPTQLQTAAEVITINGNTVKSVPGGTAYNGQNAENECTSGNTNTFVFTVR